jgi:hypothetical protein
MVGLSWSRKRRSAALMVNATSRLCDIDVGLDVDAGIDFDVEMLEVEVVGVLEVEVEGISLSRLLCSLNARMRLGSKRRRHRYVQLDRHSRMELATSDLVPTGRESKRVWEVRGVGWCVGRGCRGWCRGVLLPPTAPTAPPAPPEPVTWEPFWGPFSYALYANTSALHRAASIFTKVCVCICISMY